MAGILKVDRVQSDSNLSFQIAGANVAYMNSTGMNITGGQIIGNGQIYRDTNGLLYANNGISFPATQASSSDANTLDDYEEGTWTPTFIGSTTNPTVTYGFQTGSYVKIGRLVYATCRISCSAVSGGSGYLYVWGLPFSPTGNHGYFGGGSLTYRAGWVTAAPDIIRIFSSPLVELYLQTATGETIISPSNLQAGTDLILNCLYQTIT